MLAQMKKEATRLEEWQVQDAQRLRQHFNARTETAGEGKVISQMEFGAKYNIGSQGMVWQYLSGRRPLNIKAAVAFARGLGIKVSDFSPNLAAQIGAASEVESERATLQIAKKDEQAQLQWVTEEEAELLSGFRNGSPAQRERVLILTRSFSASVSGEVNRDKAK
jgi:hypothetical protein